MVGGCGNECLFRVYDFALLQVEQLGRRVAVFGSDWDALGGKDIYLYLYELQVNTDWYIQSHHQTKMSEKKPLGKRIADSKFGTFIREKVKPVAGDVLKIVGDVTGVEAIERVGELLNADKEKSDAHRQLALEFEKYKLEWELEMHRIDVQNELETYKAEVEDRTSARLREAEYTKTTGGRDWLMAAVVITGLLLLVTTIMTLTFIVIPQENQRLADMCFGAIMSIGASIFSYYVGSSKSSALKDNTIHKLTNAE